MPDAVPLPRSIDDAMRSSDALRSLTRRLAQSKERLLAIQPALPTSLRAHVTSGGLDDTSWTVLADSNAAAAKLRQLVPLLEQAMVDAGLQPVPIRIRVLPR